MLAKVVELGFTLENYIFLQVSRSFYENTCCAYHAIIAYHEIMFASCILSNNPLDFSMLPHLAYMYIRALITSTFNAKVFKTNIWWMYIPSSKDSFGGTCLKNTGKGYRFRFTPNNCFHILHGIDITIFTTSTFDEK